MINQKDEREAACGLVVLALVALMLLPLLCAIVAMMPVCLLPYGMCF